MRVPCDDRGSGPAREAAEEAVRQVPVDPAKARALAAQALALARAEGDMHAASTAQQALGMAARKDHDISSAVALLRRSVSTAERAGLPERAAQARVVLAGTLALAGSCTAAMREADRAEPLLRGRDLALLHLQRSFILHTAGRLEEALEGYRRALPAFRRAGDRTMEARTLGNRGSIHAHLGLLTAAEADLAGAERLYTELGQERAAADARTNLGWLAARRGDLPLALSWFDRADAYFRARDIIDPMSLFDRCEALLSARLVAEARQAAAGAIERLSDGASDSFLAEARLRLSEAALLDGDTDAAIEAADAAYRAFAVQRRPGFAALARYASVQAAHAVGGDEVALLRAARRTADELATAGWVVASLDARLIAARTAMNLGRLGVARNELRKAGAARSRGPVALRSRAWHAEALLRLADGNRRGAGAALLAGMRVIEDHRAVLGATELRARASAHATDLAHLGLRLALEDGKPERVLAWAERWRAGCLHVRPVKPPVDPALDDALIEVRRVAAQVTEATGAGRETARLLARMAALEAGVRRRALQAPGPGWYRSHPTPTARMCRESLDGRALVELVEFAGALHAVVVADGPVRLRPLCPTSQVVAEVESLRFSLRRLAYAHGSARSLEASRRALSHSAGLLDDLLFGPLREDIGDRSLVVVPAGPLHALPWSVLPSCAGRAVTIAPSAALWYRAATAPAGGGAGGVVLVGGPGLTHTAGELRALGRLYPDVRCLDGPDATVDAVRRALDGAVLAHVAAHGRFRADSPLFSSLEMTDGPLTVYDLESLRQAPTCLVLSACDAGLSEVCPGDELMGLAAALLALGTRSVIASVMPVPDTGAPPLMVALHEAMRAGKGPAAALAQAQVDVGVGDVAGSSFVCLGAG